MVQLVNTIKLYKDPVKVQLVQLGGGIRNNNLPLDDNDFRAFKGVTSDVEFSVRNNDRRPINLVGKELFVLIRNPNNQELMLKKQCEKIDEQRGKARLLLSPNEVIDWSPGFYNYTVIIENEDTTQNMLFMDKNQLAQGTLELQGGVLPSINQSITLNPQEFTPAGFVFEVTQWNPDRYMSSAVPGAGQLGLTSGLHTFALFGNKFAGKFWVQGSLDPEPSTDVIPPNTDWFDIEIEGQPNPITWTRTQPFNGVNAWNFYANVQWIRFMYQPSLYNEGKLTKIQYVP